MKELRCPTLKVSLQMQTLTTILLTLFTSSCALIQLPLALVGAVLSIVQIPVNMALGLVGPATNTAIKAAPYAAMLARRENSPSDLDFMILQPAQGESQDEFRRRAWAFASTRSIASIYPHAEQKDLKDFLQSHNTPCYLATI